jgi:tyrosine-protein kinase
MPPNQQTDINHILHVLRRRMWVVIGCVVLLPVAVYILSSLAAKRYESTVTLQVQPSAVDTTLFEGGAAAPQRGAIAAAARLIKTTGVARSAAKKLDPPPANPRSLLGKVTVNPDDEAGLITIKADDRKPRRAADIADAFAGATIALRSGTARKRVDEAIGALSSELRSSGGSKTSRDQLSQQLQRLRAVRAAQGSNAVVLEPASVPGSPVSPRPVRNTALAAIVAILLGIALAFFVERLDRRLRSPHELEELTGLPLLTSVPASAFPNNQSSGAEAEAFQTLRASLTYFNVDRPLRTILVASPMKGDGKTTVATNLAVSLTKSGKNVILVDADLRRPQVAERLGVDTDVGLGAVLAGEVTVDEALIDFHVDAEETLRVLPAGPPPPNPSELLGSERMHALVRELNVRTDIVVIDSTPILPVSDILPLIRDASGVVAVGRLNATTRDSLRRFQEVVTMAGGSLLGIVATDARAGGLYDGYGYGYGYGYAYSPYTAEPRPGNGEPRAPAPGVDRRQG